jgi:hypothetical protein
MLVGTIINTTLTSPAGLIALYFQLNTAFALEFKNYLLNTHSI